MNTVETARSEPPRVAILFGGRSSEHSVSLATAAGVLKAIDRQAYEAIPIGITKTGQWVLLGDEAMDFALQPEQLPEVREQAGYVVLPQQVGDHELQILQPGLPAQTAGRIDVVFPLLHGPFGEDGTLQGLLELADIGYVGSGVLASASMMDKQYMKIIFAGQGLPIGPYTVITDRQWRTDPQAGLQAAATLDFPVFVKPCRAGSSMGITKVDDPEGLTAAIEAARVHDPKVIVEAGIVGREIECAVLQGRDLEPPRVSQPGEIEVVRGHDFYDFEAKYLAENDVQLSCPAQLSAAVTERVRTLAAAAFDAAGCEGLARVDFFVTPDEQVIINEINTMPGFTPFSMYPRMWATSGLSYSDLITELIELARSRPRGLR